jgi:small subunit ribosomal protein S6e
VEKMVKFKVVISDPKTGKSVQREVDSDQTKAFQGKRIGEHIKGDTFGLADYEFEISGGSDTSGFPMRKDVDGTARKKILIVKGVGLREMTKGIRRRKTVAGNTVSLTTAQINLKILKAGKEKLFEDKKEEKAEEAEKKE